MTGKDSLKTRLSIIEGQIKGIAKMVDSNTSCEDILMQISAAGRALQSVACRIMENHIEHSVEDGIKCGSSDKTVANLISAFERFSKI